MIMLDFKVLHCFWFLHINILCVFSHLFDKTVRSRTFEQVNNDKSFNWRMLHECLYCTLKSSYLALPLQQISTTYPGTVLPLNAYHLFQRTPISWPLRKHLLEFQGRPTVPLAQSQRDSCSPRRSIRSGGRKPPENWRDPK